MLKPRILVSTISVSIALGSVGMAWAQDFPNKPIRVVTLAPGSSTDFIARLIAQGISGPLGQPAVVDNRGIGMVSAEIVAKAPPDGYTLLVSADNLWVAPLLLQKVPYDPVKDFAPITLTERSANVLVVHPSVAAKSVKELIALAKAKPGALNYAASSAGGTSHLAAELFKAMAGVNVVRIAYKGSGAAAAGVVAGEVQMIFGSAAVVTPHLKSGKLRPLAVTSLEPSALFPDLPTVAATVPGYAAVGITAVLAPAHTSQAIINRLNQEMVRTLKTAEARERFLSIGSEVVGSSPEELAAAIKFETARWGKVIKDAGIRAE